LEKDFINHNVIIESYTGSISFYSTGYSNNLFKSEIIPLTVNYYDNYDFITLNGISLKWVIPITGYGTQYTNAKGLLTGMRTYILDKAGINYTTNAMYYDDRGRVVQTHNKNHLGGYDHVYNQYDFIGHITKTYKEHSQNTSTVIRELYRNVYDQAGRLVLTRYFLSSYNDTITLVSNSYDDLGRLIKKQRHNNTDNETIDYNIRNWATKITSGTFIEELFYNINNISNISPCFNGNISATTWTYNGVKKAYSYTYNDLNQLTIAQGYQVDGNYLLNPNNKEQFYYDKQGNIVSMTRQKDNISKLLDDLSFHYNGNQVTSVDDYSGSLNLYATKEYYEKSRANNEMTYDPNGNMIKDLDRDIVTIQYNILNLPDTIQFKNGNQIINKYDASGQKLRTDYFTRITAITPIDPGKICAWTYTANEVDQTGTAYVDNKEYTFTGSQSGIFTLKRIHNAEGYVDFNWGSTNYNYYRRDHLGNIREVWGRTPGGFLTVQQTQYYPSGLPWTEGTGASLQPFKYNNKEFIEMNGYDTYDYGARGYYPAMGRFTSMDPLAEIDYSVSPYAYCKGNPVNRIDPTGMWTETDTGYTTNDPNEISDFFNQQKNNNHEEKIEKPDPINNLKEEFLNFFGWDLNPANPDDRKQMEEGSKNRVKAAKDIKEVNKFLIINGVLFFTGEGVSYCIEEVGGAIIVRLLSKEAMNAAEVGGEALTQFNSVESLLEGAGTLNKVKAGMQGFVPGDGASIFKTLIKNGTKQANGTYILEDGTTLFSHFSTKTGVYTIDINKAGQIFKIRIGQ